MIAVITFQLLKVENVNQNREDALFVLTMVMFAKLVPMLNLNPVAIVIRLDTTNTNPTRQNKVNVA